MFECVGLSGRTVAWVADRGFEEEGCEEGGVFGDG